MAINVSSNFLLSAQLPLDSRTIVADVTARNAIPAIQRFQGMRVFLTSNFEEYQLWGGVADSNWVLVSPGVNYVPALLGAARDIFVSPAGSDSNNGDTIGTPYQTLNRCVQRLMGTAVPGYWRVNIADGTYNETLVLPDMLGGRGSASMGNSIVEWIGNEATPTNVVISSANTMVTIFNCNASHLFAGIDFTGTGANMAMFITHGVFFTRNCNFTDVGIAILATNQSRGQWLASTTGGVITNPNIAFQSNNSSFFIISAGLTMTGVRTHCYQASNNSVLGFTGAITNDVTAAPGAFAYVQASNCALINMSANATHNIDGFAEPIRMISGGLFQDNPDGTWNMNDCGVVARVTENSRFIGALSGTTTYNRTGSTPDEFEKGDIAYVYSTFVPLTWYRYHQDAAANFGCDYRYTDNRSGGHAGALPPGSTLFLGPNGFQAANFPFYRYKGALSTTATAAAFIEGLDVTTDVGNGGGHTDVYEIFINGVASGVQASITNGTHGTSTTSAALAFDDIISVRVVSDAATTAEEVSVRFNIRYS